MSAWVVIPAYQPEPVLVEIVRELTGAGLRVIVVNDGSGPGAAGIFEGVARVAGVELLAHERNRGKGAALKTGLERFLARAGPLDAVVTADADGQHLAADILAVAQRAAEEPGALVLGSRSFDAKVPARSRFGNFMTRHLLRLVSGHRLHDTQTGLRALPHGFVPAVLGLRSGGYVFELEMLLAAGHLRAPVRTVPIRTVYIDSNRSSHFRPVVDSARIYRVLLRGPAGLLAAGAADVAAFALLVTAGVPLPAAHALGRAAAVAAGWPLVRREAAHAGRATGVVARRWMAASVMALCLSALVLLALAGRVGPVGAKAAGEAAALVPLFWIVREWIWRVPRSAGAQGRVAEVKSGSVAGAGPRP